MSRACLVLLGCTLAACHDPAPTGAPPSASVISIPTPSASALTSSAPVIDRAAAEEAYDHALEVRKGERKGDSMALLDEAIRLDPTEARYFETRARDRAGKDQKGALSDFDRAVALSPRAYLLMERGYFHADRGDLELAAKDFDDAIREEPKNCQFYQAKAYGEYRGRKLEDALRSLDQAIACSPPFVQTKYLRGRVLAELGRQGEAIRQFESTAAMTCVGKDGAKDVFYDGPAEVARSQKRIERESDWEGAPNTNDYVGRCH